MISVTQSKQFWGRNFNFAVYSTLEPSPPRITVNNIDGSIIFVDNQLMFEIIPGVYGYVLPFINTLQTGYYYYSVLGLLGNIIGSVYYDTNNILDKDIQANYERSLADIPNQNVVKGAISRAIVKVKKAEDTTFITPLIENYLNFYYRIPKITSDIEVRNV
ncbi:MAG: hypothetical protein WC783_01080 [Candidatus Paceibacterota bacterium]|jgi:hypothetical protein